MSFSPDSFHNFALPFIPLQRFLVRCKWTSPFVLFHFDVCLIPFICVHVYRFHTHCCVCVQCVCCALTSSLLFLILSLIRLHCCLTFVLWILILASLFLSAFSSAVSIDKKKTASKTKCQVLRLELNWFSWRGKIAWKKMIKRFIKSLVCVNIYNTTIIIFICGWITHFHTMHQSLINESTRSDLLA